MKKLLLASLIGAFAVSAHAHRVWVSTDHTHGGEILKAELGYGEFPDFEPIAKDRQHIFANGMQLITEKGKQNLVRKGFYNYQYQSATSVKDGSYLVVAEYAPTFWSKNEHGWHQKNMQEVEGASYCEQTRMYGKNIVNVGHESATKDVITRPVGQLLEIVPLDNPENIHVGDRFKVRVLYKGEPLPNATVTATFDGFDTSDRSKTHKTEAQAFSDKTGADGTVDIIPLRQGFWKANVEHSENFANPEICQKMNTYTTLTFQIGHSHH